MNRFKNILYVSHGLEKETDGLKQALSLARNNEASLTLLILAPALPSSLQDYADTFYRSLKTDARDALANMADSLEIDISGMNVCFELCHGKAQGVQVIEYAIRHDIDLIVKMAQEDGKTVGFRALDMDLLRKCPCPVWLCRPITKSRDKINVAVAVDPDNEQKSADDLSVQMLVMAENLSKTCSGTLHIISCWDFAYEDYLRNNPLSTIPEIQIQNSLDQEQDNHHAALAKLINRAELDDDKMQIHHHRGQADKLIPDFVADHDIDILVMRTVARTGIPGFIIGNTAENIVQELSCSLLALKPDDFESPVKI